MTTYHVTTLDRATSETFIYEVNAASEDQAVKRIISGIESGSKRGDTVYDVCRNEGEGDPLQFA